MFLLVVCGAAMSVSAYTYYSGTVEVNPASDLPNSYVDANDEIQIKLIVKRYISSDFSNYLSRVYCDVYGPDGTKVGSNYKYLDDLGASTLNWTIFDNSTNRDFGKYTVKYYTSNDDGGSFDFYVTTASGTYSNLKWSYNAEKQELVISGSGTVPRDNAPWRNYSDNISSIVIENGITSISESAFRGYSSLTTVTLPNTLTQIADWAFYDCTSLTTINLPNKLTKIGEYAFNDCSALTSITLPKSLVQVGDCAFADCSSLQNITFSGSIQSLGYKVFAGTAVRSLELPSGMVTVPQSAFNSCYYLKTVYIPKTVKAIETCAFQNCSSLTTVYYAGTKTAWNQISIASYGNDAVQNASFKYKSTIPVAKVTLKKAENLSGAVKLTWGKASNVSGYYIYRKANSGSWKKIATITNSSTVTYTDKYKLVSGRLYYYKVKAYKGSTVGEGTSLTKVYVAPPTLRNCTSQSTKSVSVYWKKDSNITGYQLKYTVGSTSKTVTIKKNATVKYVIKNLTKGKTCTVRIRGYRTVGGKTYYSVWSSAKKTVVK